ncbi:MAG TPA: hypothetical protein DEH78_28745, partial [Solibacterales bacterium]|nr:hypothetical protein [Bryobacterales bacterium]
MKRAVLLFAVSLPCLADQCSIPLLVMKPEPVPNARVIRPDASKMAPMPVPALPAPACDAREEAPVTSQLREIPEVDFLKRKRPPRWPNLIEPLPAPLPEQR